MVPGTGIRRCRARHCKYLIGRGRRLSCLNVSTVDSDLLGVLQERFTYLEEKMKYPIDQIISNAQLT